ncbi:OFA family MFS transporter [Achromobacter aloeverae]|uniref:MFS transporter n=1 Tax=Achromobacter aloeverae TaxID=1750518 RepID=A0A4Q1HNP3_9BURK|nr:OFA family MFS transporter [Achromobacter aloeverae]RXN92608.1 MFS transporter [Achromobacter aloeverae]
MNTATTLDLPGSRPGFLDKERTIAGPGFSRWLVPPAALAIHLCIGMAYGFSVFWLPLSRALGGAAPKACGADVSLLDELFTTTCDWRISSMTGIFILFFVVLGCSAALWGGWLERAGPRKAGLVSALCWCGGLVISALGIYVHQLWMLWVGSGIIGGVGLGLGYISPVSTLIKWFPDRRGMATGMAIMGFGGGAMVGAPLANALMRHYAGPGSPGVWQTFLTMAAIYAVFMVAGALGYRVPAANWKPEGWTAPAAQTRNAMITHGHVHVKNIWSVPQFWLVWLVLCLNVTAGIGILGMASPLLQEVFGGRLINQDSLGFAQLNKEQLAAIATIAAGFTGLLSLFNIGGRFIWASLSDKLGRKMTYAVFFVVGIVLYASVPWSAHNGHLALFVGAFCIILSFYGGGFSTVPAYLADLFGTQMVGAIHGRLLTAWSAAGIFGPMLISSLREYQLSIGVPRAQVYDITMYILAGLLVLGLLCNLAIRPVNPKHFMTDEELATEKALAHERASATAVHGQGTSTFRTPAILVLFAWACVVIPLAYGFWGTLQQAVVLFR